MRMLNVTVAALVVLSASSAFAQTTPNPAPPAQTGASAPDPAVREGQQLLREGKHEAALASFRKVLETTPDSFAANLQSGVVLDLLGRYTEARAAFTKAIAVAPTPQNRISATRAMAMSYAFERNCAGAAKYEAPLYEEYVKAGDF